MRHGEVRLRNVTLAQGVKFAFNVDADSLVVGPDWIKTPDVLFDVDAKAPPETGSVDKGGPRFSAVSGEAHEARAEVRAGHLALHKVSVALFIRYLSAFTNRPIRDRTSKPKK
jgi:hypothetical protein